MDMSSISIGQLPQNTLLLGSALIAFGLTIVLAVGLAWWRRRRKLRSASAPILATIDITDDVETPTTETVAADLHQIDSRLDDVESCLLMLTARVDALLRQRSNPELRSTRVSAVEHAADAPSAEFAMLRELVARSD